MTLLRIAIACAVVGAAMLTAGICLVIKRTYPPKGGNKCAQVVRRV